MPLLYQYSQSWRLHGAVYRFYAGTAELVAQAQRVQLTQLGWLSVLLFAAVLALRTRSWVFLAVVTGLTLWKLVQLISLLGLAKRAAFGLRDYLRRKPTNHIQLVIDEEGLRELAAGVESFAPWSSVKRYFVFRGVVGIELANGLSAFVPSFGLSSQSSEFTALVACLERHNIPRDMRHETLGKNAT